MEDDVLDGLDDLGYKGPLNEEKVFHQAIEGGPSSMEFTALISWLAKELHNLSGLEATVSPTSSADEAESFELELSGLLSELNCPYSALTQGEMINRFGNQQNRLRVLDFLTSELQAAKIVANRPKKVEAMEVDKQCGWHVSSQHLKNICLSLKLSKPPVGVTAIQLFNKIEDHIRTSLNKAAGSGGIGKPILNKKLSEQQWAKLGKINERMRKEYTLRRQMLLKRLDVTVQSFQWSERVKGKLQNDLVAAYRPKRSMLAADSQVTIATLMAAREDLAKMKKTSSGSVRKNTKSAINKIIMGHVPDRGGRPLEATPPPMEMPSFRKRSQDQAKEQRPQNGRGGGRGGRVQGGWSGGGGGQSGGWSQGGASPNTYYQEGNQGGGRGGHQGRSRGGYQQGGAGGYQQGGAGGYQQGGAGGYQQGGAGGYQQGGAGGYQQGGAGGYQQGGAGGYQQGGAGGYQGGGGRGGRGGRGRRGGRK